MPNSRQHRDKATHNRSFLSTIDVSRFPDWAVVAAFYAAVHLVERLRTRMPNTADHSSPVPYLTQFPHDYSWRRQKIGKMNIFFLFCPVDSERMFTAVDKARRDAAFFSERRGRFRLCILFAGRPGLGGKNPGFFPPRKARARILTEGRRATGSP